jgi:hypothetical protein
MKKIITAIALLALFILGTGFKPAEGYGWNNHAHPFDFKFENHIDVHQQSLTEDGVLVGFLYIRFTGDDTEDGYPIAKHADCAKVPDECTVGWVINGIPVSAKYKGHEKGQHPQWELDSNDLPSQPGYTHFHWLNTSEHADGLTVGETYEGYLLKLTARDTFFFEHHGGFLVTPGIDEVTHANIVTELP